MKWVLKRISTAFFKRATSIILLIFCFGCTKAQNVSKRLVSQESSSSDRKTMITHYSYNASKYLTKVEFGNFYEVILNYDDSNELKSFVKRFNNKEFGADEVFYTIFNKIAKDTIVSEIFIVPASVEILNEIDTSALELMIKYTQILDKFGQTMKMESSKGEIIEFEYDDKYNLIRKKSFNPELENIGFKEL